MGTRGFDACGRRRSRAVDLRRVRMRRDDARARRSRQSSADPRSRLPWVSQCTAAPRCLSLAPQKCRHVERRLDSARLHPPTDARRARAEASGSASSSAGAAASRSSAPARSRRRSAAAARAARCTACRGPGRSRRGWRDDARVAREIDRRRQLPPRAWRAPPLRSKPVAMTVIFTLPDERRDRPRRRR